MYKFSKMDRRLNLKLTLAPILSVLRREGSLDLLSSFHASIKLAYRPASSKH